MDAKLNQSDLISLMAKESNISVAKAELFTKNFFDLIIEGLEQDGIVKINGLGTFKVTDVASRGSVNVNTGEKIEIKGHRKLTFTPADALKEQVNMPFAMFEPVEVDETYQPDSVEEDADNEETAETAEPVVELQPVAEEVPQPVVEENIAEESVEEATTVTEPETTVIVDAVVEETVEEESVATENDESVTEETVVEEAAVPEYSAEAAVEETVEETVAAQHEEVVEEKPVEETPDEPVVVQERPATPVIVRVPPKKSTAEKQPAPAKKKKDSWSIWLVVIMTVAVGLIFMNRVKNDDSTVIDEVTETVMPVVAEAKNEPVTEISAAEPVEVETEETVVAVEVATEVAEPLPAETVIVKETAPQPAAEVYEFVLVDELAAKNLKNITVADTSLYVADGELTVHKVAADETLTRIAREYYGDKRLWPYIVKYNNMGNPNGLCRGMEIVIPRLIPRK